MTVRKVTGQPPRRRPASAAIILPGSGAFRQPDLDLHAASSMPTRLLLIPSAAALVVAIACHRPEVPVSAGPAPTPAPARQSVQISDGESLIRAMYERYSTRWYKNATFTQRTTIYRGES